MKLIYFSWVREQTGIAEEDINLPENVETIADLMGFLAGRGENFALFENATALRAAINQEHVTHDTMIGNASEIAIFPPMTGG